MSTNPHTIQATFNTIYAEQSDAIFRFCLVRVSDRDQALDLTQETFTRFWQSLVQGKEMTHTRAFLFTIANHLIIDWYRKKKPVSLEGLAGPEDEEGYEPVQENAKMNIEMEAEGRYVLDAIQKMGPSYRQSVYLRYVEGLSPPEIASILNLSTNAVSVRINRGLEELRKLVGYDIESEPELSHEKS
ncbi:MAG: RNA polymerase sigma factor [Parcubacteria bacterium C7867-002]|nr:MAG: RNA polymerase sigma factor [Parcubacteria bacterium C7867-002]